MSLSLIPLRLAEEVIIGVKVGKDGGGDGICAFTVRGNKGGGGGGRVGLRVGFSDPL